MLTFRHRALHMVTKVTVAGAAMALLGLPQYSVELCMVAGVMTS